MSLECEMLITAIWCNSIQNFVRDQMKNYSGHLLLAAAFFSVLTSNEETTCYRLAGGDANNDKMMEE